MIYQLIAKLQHAPAASRLERELTLDIIEKLLERISQLEDRIERLEERSIDTGERMGDLP
jgi:hypothetical protein